MPATYPALLDRLLTLGEPALDGPESWLDYCALGISLSHVDALASMATDSRFDRAEPPGWWAPIHAVRALAQLGPAAASAAPVLIALLHRRDDDWLLGLGRIAERRTPKPNYAALDAVRPLPRPWRWRAW